jgi:hypothetical protein
MLLTDLDKDILVKIIECSGRSFTLRMVCQLIKSSVESFPHTPLVLTDAGIREVIVADIKVDPGAISHDVFAGIIYISCEV